MPSEGSPPASPYPRLTLPRPCPFLGRPLSFWSISSLFSGRPTGLMSSEEARKLALEAKKARTK